MKKFNVNTVLNIIPILSHTTLNVPYHVWSLKLSRLQPGLNYSHCCLLSFPFKPTTFAGSICMLISTATILLHTWTTDRPTSQTQTMDFYLPSRNSILIDSAMFLAQWFFNFYLSYWALNPNKIFYRCQANKNGTTIAERKEDRGGGSTKINYQDIIAHYIINRFVPCLFSTLHILKYQKERIMFSFKKQNCLEPIYFLWPQILIKVSDGNIKIILPSLFLFRTVKGRDYES